MRRGFVYPTPKPEPEPEPTPTPTPTPNQASGKWWDLAPTARAAVAPEVREASLTLSMNLRLSQTAPEPKPKPEPEPKPKPEPEPEPKPKPNPKPPTLTLTPAPAPAPAPALPLTSHQVPRGAGRFLLTILLLTILLPYHGCTYYDRYPEELDASVLSRLPCRTSTDDRYFGDDYQALTLALLPP